jgi:hypothetical protein
MSRPLADIDEEKVARLARDGASNREIAALVGCDEGTIRGRFSALVTKKRAERRVWLRARQNKSADEGNVTMLIWLGKQELDQADKAPAQPPSEDPPATDEDGRTISP